MYMRQNLIASAAIFAAGLLFTTAATYANADEFTLQFSVSQFGPSNGNMAPVTPVAGSISWVATSEYDPIQSLVGIDLLILGHSYSIDELSYSSKINATVIGGSIGGEGGLTSQTTDFRISWATSQMNPIEFGYTVPEISGIWSSSTFDTFNISASPVPEPDSKLQFLIGAPLVLIAVLRRKCGVVV